MISRSKVMNGLADISNNIVDGYITEPEIAVNTIAEAMEILKEQPEIVRCKDCKHRTIRVCNKIEFWECNHLRYGIAKCGVTDDWFCADGEVKQDELSKPD